MKKTYETFSEIAEEFIDGGNISHIFSDHNSSACYVWQEAIAEFAGALDDGGFKPKGNYGKFWDNVTDRFKKWAKFSKDVKVEEEVKRLVGVEITKSEAEELFSAKCTVGQKLYVPFLRGIYMDRPEVYFIIIKNK